MARSNEAQDSGIHVDVGSLNGSDPAERGHLDQHASLDLGLTEVVVALTTRSDPKPMAPGELHESCDVLA